MADERPKYGMLTNPARDIVREIRSAKSMGFDFVELGLEIPEGSADALKGKQEAILKVLASFSHPAIAHTAYWLDLWTDYEEVRNAYVNICKRLVHVAASLGCMKINIHSPHFYGKYSQIEKHKRRGLSNFVKSLREISSFSKPRGVMVILENSPTPKSVRLKDFSHIVESVRDIGVHLDTGHAFIEEGMRGVEMYLRAFRQRLEHIHFNDNLGISDEHIGIGDGAVDFIKVMKILRRFRYSKTITLEVFSSRKDLKDSLKYVKDLEEDLWSR